MNILFNEIISKLENIRSTVKCLGTDMGSNLTNLIQKFDNKNENLFACEGITVLFWSSSFNISSSFNKSHYLLKHVFMWVIKA